MSLFLPLYGVPDALGVRNQVPVRCLVSRRTHRLNEDRIPELAAVIEVRRPTIRVSAERKVCCEKTDNMGGSDEYVEGWKRWLLRTSCGVAAHCKLRNHRGPGRGFRIRDRDWGDS